MHHTACLSSPESEPTICFALANVLDHCHVGVLLMRSFRADKDNFSPRIF